MQKHEFLELIKAAIQAAKSVRGDHKNSSEVSRFIDAMNRLKEAPKSLAYEVICTNVSMGKSLTYLSNHKNPQVRSEGKLLWTLWLQILYASGRERSGNKETPVNISTDSMKKTGDSKRDKVREVLHTSLAKVATEVLETEMKKRVVSCDPWMVAVSVESAMFEKLGCFVGSQKAKYRSILFNMGDSNNPDLRRKVLIGEVNGERLVTMDREEMGSENIQKEVQRIKEKARFKEETGINKMLHSADLIMT